MSDPKSLLATLAAEGADLERSVKGTVTDSITAWANSQYLSAAHASLAAAADLPQRMEIARRFARDWAFLRRADQRSERLRIDRLRVRLTKRAIDNKWEEKKEAGMAQIIKELKEDPKAWELFQPLNQRLREQEELKYKSDFRRWLQRPHIRKEVLPDLLPGLSSETLQKVKHELQLEN